MQRQVHRRGAFQRHVKIGGHGAGRRLAARLVHEVNGRGPVAVAIEERAADAAVEDAVEGLVMRLRRPLANELVALLEALDPQTFVICGSASEAMVVGRVGVLNAFHFAENATTSGKKSWKRRSSSMRESARWC